MIELQHVSAGYGAQDVVRDVSFAAPNGQLTALIGPNGSGKTTLLRAMTRTLPCRSGNILLDDRSIASYGRKEFARTAAFMPQSRPVPGITVRALVAHGRFPYLGFSRRMTAQDTAAVEQAMHRTGTLDWANRDVRALSGGERQRVYLAMALAQGGTTILLDEPGAFLDVRAQFELLDLLRSVAAGGKAWYWLCTSCPRPCSMRIALPCWAAVACLAAIPPLPLLPPVRWIGCLASVCAVRGWGVVCEGGGVSKFWVGRVLKKRESPVGGTSCARRIAPIITPTTQYKQNRPQRR